MLPLNDVRFIDLLAAWGAPSVVELRSHLGGAPLGIGEIGEGSTVDIAVIDLQSDDPSPTVLPDVPHGFASLEAMSVRAVFPMFDDSKISPSVIESVPVDMVNDEFSFRAHEDAVKIGAIRAAKNIRSPWRPTERIPVTRGNERNVSGIEENTGADTTVRGENRQRCDAPFSGNDVRRLLPCDGLHPSSFSQLTTVPIAESEANTRYGATAVRERAGQHGE